jgi:hypothetical protein
MFDVPSVHHSYLHSVYICLSGSARETEGISEMNHFKNMDKGKEVETKYICLCFFFASVA